MSSYTEMAFIFFAFISGAIPFGWIVARLWGVNDLRSVGSHNTGATNVVRAAGWGAGALTFFLDAVKCMLPMFFFKPWADPVWVGSLAVAGHCFSPFLGFRGGKGVSSTFGFFLMLNPFIGGATLLVYIVSLAATRTSAISSLFSMLAGFLAFALFEPALGCRIAVGLVVLLVLVKHEKNWEELLSKIIVALALIVAGQSGLAKKAAASQNQHSPQLLSGSENKNIFSTVQDFRGKTIRLFSQPRRVVVLTPNLAELLVDLGQADAVVGVPEFTEAQGLPGNVQSIGTYVKVSIERVLKLKPDLVLASIDANDEKDVLKLEKFGLSVFVSDSASLEDIVATIQKTAILMGVSQLPAIQKKNSAFEAALFHQKTPENPVKTVFFQVGWNPIVAIGGKGFASELIQKSGGKNIFGDWDQKYPRPGIEEVLKRDPEFIVIAYNLGQEKAAQGTKAAWEKFGSLKAVRNNQILLIRSDQVLNPGFRLQKGLEGLRTFLSGPSHEKNTDET